MLHRLFLILSALSLVLCVATCVLWVRSYWIKNFYFSDTTDMTPTGGGIRHYIGAASNRGILCWGRRVRQIGTPGFAQDLHDHPERHFASVPAELPDPQDSPWKHMGFAFDKTEDSYLIAVPFWAVFTLFGIMPVTALFLGRLRKT